jgi:hypothetical protein
MFSFNNPFGACPKCTGLGVFMKIDPERIMPDMNLSINKGGLKGSGWAMEGNSVANMYFIPAGMIAAGNDAYVSLLGLDTSSLTLFGFLIKNLLPVTIGNIIGGSIFVGITYWGCYRDRNKQ